VAAALAAFVASCVGHGDLLRPPGAPVLVAVEPTGGAPGSTVSVTLTGRNFVAGNTSVTVAGGEVTASNVRVASDSSLSVSFVVDASAAPGPRAVTVITPGGSAGGPKFTVEAALLPPLIGSFAPQPATIAPGDSSRLIWTGVVNASVCSIDQGVGSIPCAGGSATVRPPMTTTYMLTAVAGAASVSASATVTVTQPASPPSIGSFTASPGAIAAGDSATLSWSGIANAASCAIDHGVGGISCKNSSAVVKPAGTTTYTFTAMGASGTATAAATVTVNSAAHGSQSFGFTGAAQTFVVPAGVTELTIATEGAQGGAGASGGSGADGGLVSGVVSVTPGEVLTVIVGGRGGAGATAAGGFDGGGAAGAVSGGADGGGGGGASEIRSESGVLFVAGGGGGGGGTGANGGAGGGAVGADGGSVGLGGAGGGGGTGSAGGAGGGGSVAGGAGAAGQGGAGGASTSGGGGGGGGYFGGGGGGAGNVLGGAGGGGGGSSFATSGATGVSHQQGERAGDGQVTIQW
jgi:hypothetical protein